MPIPVNQPGQLAQGDWFEDCRYHPCMMVESDMESPGDVIMVSICAPWLWLRKNYVPFPELVLPKGTCSIWHCGLRKLTPQEALDFAINGPPDVPDFRKDVEWAKTSADVLTQRWAYMERVQRRYQHFLAGGDDLTFLFDGSM